ncbi:hypothetical protein EV715DRAFT_261867 [Schizophyllum commune]
MPRRFAVFDMFTSKAHKINRIIEAKVAQLPPSTYPARYHPCTAPNCYYANPPRSTAGIFGCLGAPEGAFTCTGRYCVSDDQALENREQLSKALRDARTEVWEEQMRDWRTEFERKERERKEAEERERGFSVPHVTTPRPSRAVASDLRGPFGGPLLEDLASTVLKDLAGPFHQALAGILFAALPNIRPVVCLYCTSMIFALAGLGIIHR